VLHDRNPQYVLESDGSIRNGYTVRLLNMVPKPRNMEVTLDGLPGATMRVNGMSEVDVRSFVVNVEPDEATTLKVFVTVPADEIESKVESFHFDVKDVDSAEADSYKAVFNAPGEKHK